MYFRAQMKGLVVRYRGGNQPCINPPFCWLLQRDFGHLQHLCPQHFIVHIAEKPDQTLWDCLLIAFRIKGIGS